MAKCRGDYAAAASCALADPGGNRQALANNQCKKISAKKRLDGE